MLHMSSDYIYQACPKQSINQAAESRGYSNRFRINPIGSITRLKV